jgi:hypothetical protein
LAFQGGCAIVGSSTGSDGATVIGGTSSVGVCTLSQQAFLNNAGEKDISK